MTTKERTENFRERHKKNNLCVDCNKACEPGKLRCQYHLDLQAMAVANRRELKRFRTV